MTLTIAIVGYAGLCVGFCLGAAATAVLVSNHRAGGQAHAVPGAINPPPRSP